MDQVHTGLSLRSRTLLITLCILLVSLSVAWLTGILQSRNQLAIDDRQLADTISLGLSNSAELAQLPEDSQHLKELVDRYGQASNILFAAVCNTKGDAVSVAAPDQEAWARFQSQTLDADSCIISRRSFQFLKAQPGTAAAPGAGSGGAAASTGAVVVAVSRLGQNRTQQSQELTALAVTLVTAGAAAGILFLTVGRWLRRVQNLSLVGRAISLGDFSRPIDEEGDDEIAQMAHAFAEMRSVIRQRDVELKRLSGIVAITPIEHAPRPPQQAVTKIADREPAPAGETQSNQPERLHPEELLRAVRLLISATQISTSVGENRTAGPSKPISTPEPDATNQLDLLSHRRVNDRDLAAIALHQFESAMNGELVSLTRSIQNHDAKAVASSAHRIKDAAASISAEKVWQIASELERLGHADCIHESQGPLEHLTQEVERFRDYLHLALFQHTPIAKQ